MLIKNKCKQKFNSIKQEIIWFDAEVKMMHVLEEESAQIRN